MKRCCIVEALSSITGFSGCGNYDQIDKQVSGLDISFLLNSFYKLLFSQVLVIKISLFTFAFLINTTLPFIVLKITVQHKKYRLTLFHQEMLIS